MELVNVGTPVSNRYVFKEMGKIRHKEDKKAQIIYFENFSAFLWLEIRLMGIIYTFRWNWHF